MNTIRMNKWLIILLLAALLPGVTAALAQQPLPEKTIPAGVGTRGESIAIPPESTESEPNNTFGTADPIYMYHTIGGKIKPAGDLDYFILDTTSSYPYFLVDIDASSAGSALDPFVCIYDHAQVEIACNDDSDGLDSLLFVPNADENYRYYIMVREYNHPNEGGNTYTYTLSLYSPLFLSAATNGSVAGIDFQAADILAHYDLPTGEKWLLFFNASDVGITQNTNSFDIWSSGYDSGLALTFQKNQRLTAWNGNIFTATPYDVVSYSGSQYGPHTIGTFWEWMIMDGSAVGLAASSEKVDAIGDLTDSLLSISTTGAFSAPNAWPPPANLKGSDEDIMSVELYYGSAEPYWYLTFDGSTVPGLATEDIIAAGANEDQGIFWWDLVILGNGVIDGQRITQKHIFWYAPDDDAVGVWFYGPDHHFNYNIDAID
jgi:hypothetical protein